MNTQLPHDLAALIADAKNRVGSVELSDDDMLLLLADELTRTVTREELGYK